MPSEPHQPLRAYVGAIGSSIFRADAFGQQMVKLIYREGHASPPGLFRRVRALADAVIAAEGTLADARAWTFQAIRWWHTGTAVEQKYARFEVNPDTARAMADLLHMLETLPDDLVQPRAMGKPLQPRRSLADIFGGASKPGSAAPASKPGSPFGGSAPANPPGNAPGNQPPARPVFGAKPPGTPFGQPANPPGNAAVNQPPARPVFGAKPAAPPAPANPPGNAPGNQPQPAPFRSPFAARLQPEQIPYHVGACFDALATRPGLAPEPAPSIFADEDDDDSNGLPDWLNPAPNAPADTTPNVESAQPLPSDFRTLLDQLHRDVGTDKPIAPLLREIGKFDDIRTLEQVYKLPPEHLDTAKLIGMFETLGGNVGALGLISLLPIDRQKREMWLQAMLSVVYNAEANDRPLNEANMEAIWRIAMLECDPALELCPSAFYLVAAMGRPEAFQFLWEHTRNDDANHRRAAYFAIATHDPGDQLESLIAGLAGLSDNLVPVPAPSPFAPRVTPVEPFLIGIPFKRLQAVITGPKAKLRPYALFLLSYLEDPRVVPFLGSQLSRKVPRLREIALSQLKRRNGRAAADAVVRLMEKDLALRQRAAALLHDWDDPRCVPVMLDSMVSTANAPGADALQVLPRLGNFAHPDLDSWLLRTVTELNEQATSTEDQIVKILTAILNLPNGIQHYLQPVAEVVRESPSIKVRLALINALSKADAAWAHEMIKTLVSDDAPVVAYRAVVACKNRELAAELLASRQELKRLQAVHILWSLQDRETLMGCLSDQSAAVRHMVIWALGDLHATDAVEPLRRLVATRDRIDKWNINPAVIAWAALAKMKAIEPPASAG